MNLFTACQSVYLGKMIKYRLISWITSKPKKLQSIIKLKQGMTCNNQLQWSSVSYNDLQKYRTLIHYELQMTYYELKWTTMNVHSKRVFEFLGVCIFMIPSGLSFLGSEFSWNKEVWVFRGLSFHRYGGVWILLWGGVGLEFFGGLSFCDTRRSKFLGVWGLRFQGVNFRDTRSPTVFPISHNFVYILAITDSKYFSIKDSICTPNFAKVLE